MCRTRYYMDFCFFISILILNLVLANFQTSSTFWPKLVCTDIKKHRYIQQDFWPIAFKFPQTVRNWCWRSCQKTAPLRAAVFEVFSIWDRGGVFPGSKEDKTRKRQGRWATPKMDWFCWHRHIGLQTNHIMGTFSRWSNFRKSGKSTRTSGIYA